MSILNEQSELILQETKEYLENSVPKLKLNVEENICKLKNLKDIFSEKFNDLLLQIEKLPQDIVIEEEISPASIKSVTTWEWEYANNSTKNFQKDDNDIYVLRPETHGTINAYSSLTMNDNTTLKIKFHDTTSFGCSGFGIISKDDPLFQSGIFSNSGSHPMFCMCCFGPWSAKYMEKKSSENLQHILKRETDKYVTFEVNFVDMMFRVFECNDQLFAEYDLNKMAYKTDLVLVFYTGSSVVQSHEIVCF